MARAGFCFFKVSTSPPRLFSRPSSLASSSCAALLCSCAVFSAACSLPRACSFFSSSALAPTPAVIGLGYVGLPLAVAFGQQLATLGFDIDPTRIAELRGGQDHTLEMEPEELASATQLRYSSDPADLDACNVYIVTVPTPIDAYEQPDLEPLRSASRLIAGHLRPGDVVVYESTV